MGKAPAYTFEPWSELVAYQGEDGTYYREAFTVACVAPDGRRWLYCGPAEQPDLATAQRHAQLMQAKLAKYNATGPWWAPNPDCWNTGPPVYGGAYHQQHGDKALHADIEPSLLQNTEEGKERAAREWEDR